MRRLTFAQRLALLVIIIGVPVGLWWWLDCGPATTMMIVRHADRPTTGEDALTAAGVARAADLAHVAGKAGLAGVYSTDTIRTRQTAAPVAAALGLTTEIYAAADSAGLVARIVTDHGGGTVLVVGHSNTVNAIIAAAGGPVLPDIGDTEFDNLFVLTACRCRRGLATLVNLQYGASSP